MALELATMAVKMVEAKQAEADAEKKLERTHDGLRKALETLRDRTARILDNPLDDGSFEVAFLDDALAEVNEADRRYEVDHTSLVAARRRYALLQEVVEGLK